MFLGLVSAPPAEDDWYDWNVPADVPVGNDLVGPTKLVNCSIDIVWSCDLNESNYMLPIDLFGCVSTNGNEEDSRPLKK